MACRLIWSLWKLKSWNPVATKQFHGWSMRNLGPQEKHTKPKPPKLQDTGTSVLWNLLKPCCICLRSKRVGKKLMMWVWGTFTWIQFKYIYFWGSIRYYEYFYIEYKSQNDDKVDDYSTWPHA